MKTTDPGRMRTKLVYVEEEETGRDEVGGTLVEWVDRFPVWALLEPLNSRETFYARQVGAETTHKIRCRYRPGITSAGRLRVARTGALLKIDGIVDVESLGVELEITAVESPGQE